MLSELLKENIDLAKPFTCRKTQIIKLEENLGEKNKMIFFLILNIHDITLGIGGKRNDLYLMTSSRIVCTGG